MTTRKRYDLHINTPHTGRVLAAECVLEEEGGSLRRVGFRYRPDYLAMDCAFAFDPVALPLAPGERLLRCTGGMPGIVDDYLPDAWGRKVLARLAWYQDRRKLNANSAIDMLALAGHSRIGALSMVPAGDAPAWEPGVSLDLLDRIEGAAQHIDDTDLSEMDTEAMSLLYLANAGAGVGGARPKALVHDGSQAWLAKFNRLGTDAYNNARVELACLNMARDIGIRVAEGHIRSGINGREVLLLERFDMTADGARHHLISVNALLKSQSTQADQGGAFRYDDIAELLRRHSPEIIADLDQLIRLMLFNRAINNLDDHERNFSLVWSGEGYRFAPAYDLVPSLVQGGYPVAGFGYSPFPPRPSELLAGRKTLGLSAPKVRAAAEEVMGVVNRWPEYAAAAGVDEQDAELVARFFCP